MIQILQGNSTCFLKNIDRDILERLRNKLCYINVDYEQMKEKIKWASEYIFLLNLKSKSFPTGLLTYAINFFNSENIPFELIDKRTVPTDFRVYKLIKDFPEFRPYQTAILDVIKEKERGTISLPTGMGKTILAAGMIKQMGKTTLFVVPSLNLVKQTLKTFTSFFGKRAVGTKSEKDQKKPIIIMNYQSLKKKPKEWFDRFDVMIMDECHHSAADSIYDANKDKWHGIYHKYFLSATPYRNDGSDLKLNAVIGDIIFHYPLAQAVRDGWLCPPTFLIYQVWNQDKSAGAKFQTEYKTHIVENEIRNAMIEGFAKNLAKNGKQVLILVREIKHGEILQERIEGSQFLKGEQDKREIEQNQQTLEAFDRREFPVLIATTVLGEGTDVQSIDVMINAAGYKARSEVIQKIGRALRILEGKPYALIIDFMDRNGNYVERHSIERMKHFREYETQIKIMEAA